MDAPATRIRGGGALAAALLLVAAAGCSWFIQSQGFRYDDVDRPARPSSHPVPVLTDTAAIERPFVVIGMVQAHAGDTEGLGEREAKAALQKEARRMGGDALIHLQRLPMMGHGAAHPIDVESDATMRDRVKVRWVAEVISFDLPSAAPGALQPGEQAPEQP